MIPTIKVKPWGAGQGDHVVINAEDFDPAVHQHFEAGGAAPLVAARLETGDAPTKPAAKRRKRKARK